MWSRETPDREGWYWFRSDHEDAANDQALLIDKSGHINEGRLRIKADVFSGLWQPIEPPKD